MTEVWRNDDHGELDDIAVPRVECFRMERMGARQWWIGLSLADGRLIHLDIVGTKTGVVTTRRDDD